MRRRFRRLRAASDFARGGKVTKTPPGTAPDEHFVLIVAFPRTPLRGTRTCWILQHFRRAKSEWRSEISTGPLRRRGFRIPRFARIGQSSLTPSLLLSNANPLRWALRWGPPSAAYWVENCRWCGSAAAPGFAEPTCPVQHMGYLICPLRGHLPLKGKALKAYPPAFPFRGRWHGRRP